MSAIVFGELFTLMTWQNAAADANVALQFAVHARPSHDACSVETEKGKGNWCPIPGGLAFGVCFDLRVLLINATELEKINMVVCLYLGI